MRVLVISGGMPTPESPLNGYFEYDQAEALSEEGVDITFFSIDLRSVLRRRHWGISHGIKGEVKWYEISLPIGNVPVKAICWIGSKALFYLFNRVYKKAEKPDIIHAHFVRTGYMASVLSKKTSIPLIITEHSSDINKPVIKPDLLKYAQKAYAQASQVIAVGNGLRRNIKENTGIDSIVIPNMIHMKTFESTKRVAHKEFRVATTAALIPLKRIERLIDAAFSLKQSGNIIYLDIIGDGPLMGCLQSKVHELKLEDIVFFHGYKKDYQIAEIYKRSDCFALVSSTETFGVVYIEAMASGLPVIATKCGGPEDFVNPTNGLLIDVDNPKQLEEAILYMKNNYSDYNPIQIRDYVLNRYSPKTIANKLMTIYDSVLVSKKI